MKKEDLYNKIMNDVVNEVKKVLHEGVQLENDEQYEKIRDIDYVFDDLEQIPNSERTGCCNMVFNNTKKNNERIIKIC